MTKFFNKLFMVLKVLLLIISFVITLYILLYMYYNLKKSPWGKDFMEFIGVLIPFALLLILYVVNIVGRQKGVNDNVFYNVTCVIVSVAIIYMAYRAMTDQNMILWHKTDFHINFDYFADQIFQIKAMLYGLSSINVFLMISHYLNKKKSLEITD